MYSRLDHPRVSYEDYRPFLDPKLADELAAVAGEMRQLRVLHLNSTATGGGVAEILQSMVPLGNSLGIETERIVINPDSEGFFQVTKKIHNLLQGAEGVLSTEELDIYFNCIQRVADEMRANGLSADVWFVHDPQLLPLARLLPKKEGETWIWICHIDLTTPNRSVLDALMPLTQDYDQLIFSQTAYVPNNLGDKVPVLIAPPAIDPLTIKNIPMDLSQAQKIVRAMGIDTARPLITQVSRFDVWKDPWGVIDAYRIARESVPGLQLALLGLSQAADDPEGAEIFKTVAGHAGGDPDIHLYFDPAEMPVSVDEVVNAIQMASQVLIQKSIREGFGLTVTEGMWKGKPVIGGDAGGIRVQINDGVSGFLVSSPEQCAQRLVELLQDESLSARMGKAAKESVRQRFLLPRLALDYLTVARSHVNGRIPAVSGD
ncbi:MAG: glycosyltransferase [Chloroflexi bacterium]|nr:glycosyltransferase [Chloroflexota bacterium]MCI0800817.1 glycosyltransferase [Chloroflexota bacterium]MCI0810659.1 glycosyltransferase [Chloroflexota bacterium]MCI0829232.1 glycosyltransferase [Chloroflexota bacterium]MCI0848790.1 glycosyltransferase [Chloroflexota bacterium]